YAPVRGARIVLCDTEAVRANITGSWLAQMAWAFYVADGVVAEFFRGSVPVSAQLSAVPPHGTLYGATPAAWLVRIDWEPGGGADGDRVVVDAARHAVFRKGHVPGAWFVIRSLLAQSVPNLPKAARYVVTCPDGTLAQFIAPEMAERVTGNVYALAGGTSAW